MNRLIWHSYAISILLLISGCSVIPKQEIRGVNLEVSTNKTINPDISGRPSPLFIEIYHLTSLFEFNELEYFELTDNYRELLAHTLIDKTEISVLPNMNTELEINHSPAVKHLGLVIGFRDIENNRWRRNINLNDSSHCNINMSINHLEARLSFIDGDCDE